MKQWLKDPEKHVTAIGCILNNNNKKINYIPSLPAPLFECSGFLQRNVDVLSLIQMSSGITLDDQVSYYMLDGA